MSPVSAASQHSQRATPISAVQTSQGFSSVQDGGTVAATPLAMSDGSSHGKVEATARPAVATWGGGRTDTPAQAQDLAEIELHKPRGSANKTVQSTAHEDTVHVHSPHSPSKRCSSKARHHA